MDEELEKLGPASVAVREALFGRRSDAQIRDQFRHVELGSDGAVMLENELKRRKQERAGQGGSFIRSVRKFFLG